LNWDFWQHNGKINDHYPVNSLKAPAKELIGNLSPQKTAKTGQLSKLTRALG
jgi:hypothetical protein